MITVEQILNAEGVELSRLLGEVLQPEERNHAWTHASDHYPEKENTCEKCDAARKEWRKPCKHVDPIPLDDWNVSMKWRDWAMDSFALFDVMEAMRLISCDYNRSYDRVYLWWTLESKPKYYIMAAAIAKINAEKGKE